MAIAVAVLAGLAFIGWLIYRAVKEKSVKAHFVSYGVAIVAGVFTYAYFLSMDFPQLIKIVASILLGIILIVSAALYQRRIAGRS
jgi:glucan phosphoethanolaminetransferase (alkaline phosphatase superfamily)